MSEWRFLRTEFPLLLQDRIGTGPTDLSKNRFAQLHAHYRCAVESVHRARGIATETARAAHKRKRSLPAGKPEYWELLHNTPMPEFELNDEAAITCITRAAVNEDREFFIRLGESLKTKPKPDVVSVEDKFLTDNWLFLVNDYEYEFWQPRGIEGGKKMIRIYRRPVAGLPGLCWFTTPAIGQLFRLLGFSGPGAQQDDKHQDDTLRTKYWTEKIRNRQLTAVPNEFKMVREVNVANGNISFSYQMFCFGKQKAGAILDVRTAANEILTPGTPSTLRANFEWAKPKRRKVRH